MCIRDRSTTISTRVRTLNGERLKVNDKMGNPIEIATVVVWHVADTAKALFDVDDYQSYVAMQAETALRHVARDVYKRQTSALVRPAMVFWTNSRLSLMESSFSRTTLGISWPLMPASAMY